MSKLRESYDASTVQNLYEIYQKHDAKKLNKYIHVLAKMEELDGWGFRILHYNSRTYSCAFIYQDAKKRLRIYYVGMNDKEQDYKYR